MCSKGPTRVPDLWYRSGVPFNNESARGELTNLLNGPAQKDMVGCSEEDGGGSVHQFKTACPGLAGPQSKARGDPVDSAAHHDLWLAYKRKLGRLGKGAPIVGVCAKDAITACKCSSEDPNSDCKAKGGLSREECGAGVAAPSGAPAAETKAWTQIDIYYGNLPVPTRTTLNENDDAILTEFKTNIIPAGETCRTQKTFTDWVVGKAREDRADHHENRHEIRRNLIDFFKQLDKDGDGRINKPCTSCSTRPLRMIGHNWPRRSSYTLCFRRQEERCMV